MRSRYQINEPNRAHFITCTIVEWLPVFNSAACCDLIVQSLAFCQKQKELRIYAWVILDNHLHAILAAPDLSAVLRDFKSFTASKIIQQLGRENREWLLNQLRYYRAAHKTGEHQIWQEGSHPQSIHTDEVMLQKLDYIHNNPVKRGMVVAPEHWRYSSAHAWLPGAQPLLQCDDWR
ncbi:MAG: transposase [Chthoniobacterales bacterium]